MLNRRSSAWPRIVYVGLGLVIAAAAGFGRMTETDAAKGAGGGARTASITLNQTDPHLGDAVDFSYEVPNKVNRPRIRVECFQDAILVWSADQSAGTSFLLGGVAESSLWLANDGPATCNAALYQSTTLATTSFSAGGLRVPLDQLR